MQKLITIAAIGMLITACSSNPETLASKMKARGEAYNNVAASWTTADEMVKEGNNLVAKGQKEYDKGSSIMKDGESHIKKGTSLIEQGEAMKAAAEAQYTELNTIPAVEEAEAN